MSFRKYVEVALGTIITLIVGTALNYAAAVLFTQPTAEIDIGTPLRVASVQRVPIAIRSWSREVINGVQLSMPDSVTLSEITSSVPLQLDRTGNSVNGSGRMAVTLSGIPPLAVSHLLIPIKDGVNEAEISFINARERNIDLRPSGTAVSPRLRALQSAALNAVIAAMAFGVVGIWINVRLSHMQDELNEQVKQAREQQERLEQQVREESKAKMAELDSLRSELDNQHKVTQSRIGRLNVLFLARINDYARELEFWRSTIRILLTQKDASDKTVDDILRTVTDKLGTHQTLRYDTDFKTIEVAARLLQTRPEVDGH